MYLKFGQYLKDSRENSGLTQPELATNLGEKYKTEFENLTFLTISRWENNKNLPTVKRIVLISEFFGDDPPEIIKKIFFNEEYFDKKINVLKKLESKFSFSPTGIQIGSFPLNDGYRLIDLNSDYNKMLSEVIVDYDYSIFNTEFPVTEPHLKKWSSSPHNICYACTYKGNYFGHLIALRLNCDMFEKLMSYTPEESAIDYSDFSDLTQPHCIYVYSIYGANKTLVSILLLELFKQIMSGSSQCKYIGGLCSTTDGVALQKHLV